jgi:WD40 repeat protein
MTGEGKLLASCSKDKCIKLWDLNSNKVAMNITSDD